MPAHHREVREVEEYVVQIGDRAAGFRATERPGVSDLGAEGQAGLDAGHIDRVVAPVVWRQVPEPWHHPHPDEPPVGGLPANGAHGLHGVVQVDGDQTAEPVGSLVQIGRDLVIGDQGARRAMPR